MTCALLYFMFTAVIDKEILEKFVQSVLLDTYDFNVIIGAEYIGSYIFYSQLQKGNKKWLRGYCFNNDLLASHDIMEKKFMRKLQIKCFITIFLGSF